MRCAFVLAAAMTASAMTAAQASDTHALQFPEHAWQLQIDLPGFVLAERRAGPKEPHVMFRANDPDTGVVVSAFLERNPEFTSKEQCRAHYTAKLLKGPFVHSDVEQVTRGRMAIWRAMMQELRGVRLSQQNVHAHLFRDGVCVEVHLSKVQYEPNDERLFEAVLRTVRFSDGR
jgi:hypothetical protein